MSVHEQASRFGPALRFWGEVGPNQLHLGLRDLTPIQLWFTWVNRFNGLTNPWCTSSTGQLVLTSQLRSAI
ncbi:hypothetical protein PIB30_106733, partial [Stylosanthes scabra]|nr:hypothetical protein [Stylosanthes scabra]